MARVYLSSTYEDLKEFREEVLTTLRRLDHIDAAMEHYVAQDERPLDKCLEDVRKSDIYIGVFAWRYGYIPPDQTESITALEYRTAKATGKTCLIFVVDEKAPWPPPAMEFETLEKIKALRTELNRDQVTAKFTDKTDLARKVGEAIYRWQADQGLAAQAGGANWAEYKAAAFAAHRLLRLQVIAGASRENFTEIPVTAVFVPQMASRELPTYQVPEHAMLGRRQLFRADGDGAGLLMEDDGEQEAPEPRDMDAVLRRRPPELTTDETVGEDEREAAALGGSFPELTTQVLGRERAQVFLGGPGSGKSTLLLYALLLLCDPALDAALRLPQVAPEAVPFLVDLRQYVLRESRDFISYIAEDGNDYLVPIEPEHVRALLGEKGKAIVLFDGLDEVFDPTKRARVIRQFEAFARQYPEATIVVTSRIAGYDREELGVAQFTHYVLDDFTLAQIREFVPRWYEHYTWEGDEKEASDLVQKIAMSPRLSELSGNPLLLTMMAVLYKREDLPEQRWKLYESCTKVLLEDWDIKRKQIGRREFLPLGFLIHKDQKAKILQRVAMYMLEHGEAGKEVNAIAEEPLKEIFSEYLVEHYKKSPGDAVVIADEILNHLAERTYVVAQIGEAIFGFVHRTFMEYFAALQLDKEFGTRKADYEWLKQEVFGPRWADSEWQEVLLLLAGMLAGRSFPITEVADYLRREYAQPVPFNLAFAARCLGEAGVVDDPKVGRELLTELVKAIAEQAARKQSTEADAFLAAGLAGFSALAPHVGVPEQAEAVIERLDSKGKGRERIVAWQLALAARSRDEQRPFALAALEDRSEVVRRAAIAALERDWPGNAEVGDALIALVGRGGSVRVRQAAIEALQRSWPKDPRLLDAIEETVDRESAYTYVVWLIEQIARHWSRHPKALPLIMRLVRPVDVANYDYQQDSVLQTATAAIVAGWRGEGTALAVLEDWAEPTTALRQRVAAIAALGIAWRGDADVGIRLREWAQNDPEAHVRGAAIESLALGWGADTDILPLLLQRAQIDPEPTVRSGILSRLTWSQDSLAHSSYPFSYMVRFGWAELAYHFVSPWRNEPRVLELLDARAIEDEDALARAAALRALMFVEGNDERRLVRLLERSEKDDSAEVRRTALQLASDRWPADERVPKLVQQLSANPDPDVRASAIAVAGSAWASAPWATKLLREHATSDGKASVRKTALLGLAVSSQRKDRELRELVFERFRQDASSEVRAAAAVILAGRVPKDPKTLAFILEGARHDRHAKVRFTCVTLLSGAIWELTDRPFYLVEGFYAIRDTGWSRLPEVVETFRVVASGDPATDVRRAAIEGLVHGLWMSRKLPNVLTELLEAEEDQELREQLTNYAEQAAGTEASATST